MGNETTPYISRNPGDLVSAEDWNKVQLDIKKDIGDKVQAGINSITSVKNAENATKFDGKTVAELTQEIIDKALQILPTRTGYQMLFKQLKVDEEKVIKHELKACPLVDVYQLDYFKVVCSEDEDDRREAMVNFYLYHSGEKRIRITAGGTTTTIEIEPASGQVFKVLFTEMLNRYQVPYTDSSSLDDLENEFWKALFKAPNDEFENNQYCHSPWFEKCCGEKRTVKELKDTGAWNDMWFKMQPRKTTNYPGVAIPGSTAAPTLETSDPTQAPTQLHVVHFDFDTIGVKAVAPPIYPQGLIDDITRLLGDNAANELKQELKIMLLLKV